MSLPLYDYTNTSLNPYATDFVSAKEYFLPTADPWTASMLFCAIGTYISGLRRGAWYVYSQDGQIVRTDSFGGGGVRVNSVAWTGPDASRFTADPAIMEELMDEFNGN